MNPWIKRSQRVRKIGFKTLIFKDYEMPDGKVYEYTTWGSEGTETAAVIALTGDDKVVIARQFRPGPEKILDELPGGMVDPGESAEQAGLREMLEETGYSTDEPLEYVGMVLRDAYSNETGHFFIARNCRLTADSQKLEAGEYIDVTLIDIDMLIRNAMQGNMTDAVGVLMARDKLMKRQE
jgi:ADP-ribose pyrophosphatase